MRQRLGYEWIRATQVPAHAPEVLHHPAQWLGRCHPRVQELAASGNWPQYSTHPVRDRAHRVFPIQGYRKLMSCVPPRQERSMPSRRSLMLGLAAASLLVSHANTSEEQLLMHASGYFDVTLAPQAADTPQVRTAQIDRLSIDKKYHGDVRGTSTGQMQAIKDDRSTGAYVA